MNPEKIHYVICYDIPDDKRRTKLAKTLDGYGDRVQYSVFEAVLNRELFDKLIIDINGIIEPKEDMVTIYFLCAACDIKRVKLGLGANDEKVGDEIVFIA